MRVESSLRKELSGRTDNPQRALALERQIKETDNLEARIEALERTHERAKGVRPWRGA